MKLLNLLVLILIGGPIVAQSRVGVLVKDSIQLEAETRVGPGDPYYFGGFINKVKPYAHLEHSLSDQLRLSPYVYTASRNYQEGGTDATGLVSSALNNSLVYYLEPQLKKRRYKNWLTSALLLGLIPK